ncbi:MAG: hypothetical protein F6K09_37530, partial [Merismopedia sp. SIO2A8]|nr:hypothetical protein [Merismopedia sp. SIO2A8]
NSLGWRVISQPNEFNNAGLFQGVKSGARVTLRFTDIPSTLQISGSFQEEESISGASTPTNNSPLIDVVRVDPEQLTRYTLSYRPQPIVEFSNSTELDISVELEHGPESVGETDVALPSESEVGVKRTEGEAILGQDDIEDVMRFGDVKQAPDELQAYVSDLIALSATQEQVREAIQGSTTLRNQETPVNFFPNVPISRREYARWLFTLNNILYGDRPSKQIYLGDATDQPIFQDILPGDPDFGVIQGLAEAGLIASPLTSTDVSSAFQPDAPVTRELLVVWKVPLDIRGMPTATVEDIQATWVFQDTEQINDISIGTIVADYQNGDRSNIRRAFGYTLLFQPQKVVTRAEAAAALWHFGNGEDGISVRDYLKMISE